MILHCIDIAAIALELLRPQHESVVRARQPGGDAKPGAQTLDRTRYDAAHAQRAAHLEGIDWLSLECVRRRTSGNANAGHTGECVRDLVGHAVAQVLVVRLTADVGKREYGGGSYCRCPWPV